jgi:hypothetical protein
MTLVDSPPMAWASDVVGSTFENVGASECGFGTSRTTLPFSSRNILLWFRGVLAPTSECISPRLE